jgi:hypothetical protein
MDRRLLISHETSWNNMVITSLYMGLPTLKWFKIGPSTPCTAWVVVRVQITFNSVIILSSMHPGIPYSFLRPVLLIPLSLVFTSLLLLIILVYLLGPDNCFLLLFLLSLSLLSLLSLLSSRIYLT